MVISDKSNYVKVVKLILEQEGANADIRDLNGCTPLYGCTIYNFPHCALILLKVGPIAFCVIFSFT